MSWTTPGDLRKQVMRLWERGELLGSVATGESLFPRRLSLRGPSSTEIADRFEDIRQWIGELRAMPHCRVEMREFRHRVFGANALPEAVWLDTVEDAAAFIGKQRETARFVALLEMTRKREARLVAWLAGRPLRALEVADVWGRLLDICAWFQAHPRPGVYLRQVDIPDVHSKFIEGHRGVLAELLDRVLIPEAIDPSRSGVNQFASRFGLREKPLRIRFRILDADKALFRTTHVTQDITLDAASFIELNPNVRRIFITENEINFLTFPPVKDSMVIFGAGYGFEMLANARWLSSRRIYY
jgi:hypothetical protein